MSRWHPREHRKALDGMLALTLEERGAYNTCLDLIYDREGPIPDDARWLAGWMGVTPRKWSAIRAALIVKAKLFAVVVNSVPSLMNGRAVIELENLSKKSRELSENGAKGGRATAERNTNLNENNASDQAPPQLLRDTSTETDREDSTTINAGEWARMLDEAKEAAGDAADLTRPAMHHAADLRPLIAPKTGEPCTWPEVLDAIGMVAMRQRAKGKLIPTWKWVQDDAWALRDKRLNADAPPVSDVVQLRATGPPRTIDEKSSAAWDYAERRIAEDG